MNEQRQQTIRDSLRQGETQVRLERNLREARENITVTISRAAALFGFSESKLREWEKKGLLQAERSLLPQEGKGATGHRQYTQGELDKLAIIRDLLDHGYAVGDIPANIDQIWREVASEGGLFPRVVNTLAQLSGQSREGQLPIDARIEQTDRQEFWRYFVTQALRISLALICEDVPDTTVAGLVLPLQWQNQQSARAITTTADLARVGLALIGWQGADGSFYTFLDDAPTFEYPSDFRLEAFPESEEGSEERNNASAPILVIVQRKARQFVLSAERIGALHRLFQLVYAHMHEWQPCFDYGRRDWLYQAHDLTAPGEKTIFNYLVEQVIELGGVTTRKSRWSFCVLLLPRETHLPVQQQSLVVRAQTRHSPYEIDLTTINPHRTDQANSLVLRAFQSGQIVATDAALAGESMLHPLRLQVITSTPQMIANPRQVKASQKPASGEAVHSALAIPVIGDYGISTAVFYVEASEANAFSQEDLRVLRIIGRMVEELLQTSRARSQVMGRRGNVIDNPAVVDTTFEEFLVETDFIAEIDALLSSVQQRGGAEERGREELSIISVDIDNQSRVAMQYGNRVARNLSQQVGARIRGQMRLVSRFQANKLFHISADKYYLVLEGVSLADACDQARQLKNVLGGDYRILPTSATPGRPVLPENMLEVPDVTVHIGIASYPFAKLDELLMRYPLDVAKIYVRTLIMAGIEELLDRGKNEGGNCIITWHRESWGYQLLA